MSRSVCTIIKLDRDYTARESQLNTSKSIKIALFTMLTSLKRCLAPLHFALCLAPLAVFADQLEKYRESIDGLAAEIKQISSNLNANKALLKTQNDELSNLEQAIIKLDEKIVEKSEQIELEKQENLALNSQILELERIQDVAKKSLMNLIRERYMRGEPNYLKMLLSQENPYAVGRLANYLDYFTQAQQMKFDDLRQQAQTKKALLTTQSKNLRELEAHYQQQRTQQYAKDQAKRERQLKVNKLASKVSKTSVRLEQLRQDRQRLNSLLKQIAIHAEKMRQVELEQERIAALREQARPIQKPLALDRPLVKGGFAKQRGRLSYPVIGNPEYKFGQRIIESGMRAQGTFIGTKGSVNVNSIFYGRVLFADYLKGYGLLMIIDHGDDHISLYGHNEVLYKQVGDHVQTNERVAKTGVTGGLKSHGLYFEIRNTATPIDPDIWCR
ncbi:MAG: septal ring factor EnvC (AmiA/AmiB activator) [Polaribacter sp.]|jgi:septal ring factor EnvC (AmiA/AmiB activator)